jgi:predicted nuclease with TOPRIM domain
MPITIENLYKFEAQIERLERIANQLVDKVSRLGDRVAELEYKVKSTEYDVSDLKRSSR